VQDEAKRRWDQLEADPALAGPWWQLFRQVQSPRHVLSELLQNADDVGATTVRARLSNNSFEFLHNGEDFNEDNFQSICQFGFSNKRHLHTIGFRGVGFKSVFSIGPRVEVKSPSLSFAFEKNRFTEPLWIQTDDSFLETLIRVVLDETSKAQAIRAEFDRWLASPIPLLFFNSVSRIEIQDRIITKKGTGTGPVPDSEYLCLANPEKIEVLCIRSDSEDFPLDALEEIREERGSPGFEVPPCSVQIVFGTKLEPSIYTVLPTEIKPPVPFSYNAPFIQDPARSGIKHPANSPTNRWLLQRIGKLAAKSLVRWLGNTVLDLNKRGEAYEVMPEPNETDGSLGHECTLIMLKEFRSYITKDMPILLGHDGTLVTQNNAIALPSPIIETWEPEAALKIFAPKKQKILAREVSLKSKKTLKNWGFIEVLEREQIAEKLQSCVNQRPSSPNPLNRLVHLWSYLQPLKENYVFWNTLKKLPIVPVAKRTEMLPAEKLLVVGGKETRISENDWAFLMSFADLVDPNWVRLVAGVKSAANHHDEDTVTKRKFIRAGGLFLDLGLNRKVGLEQVISAVADKIFNNNEQDEAGIKLAHIAARGDVNISKSFKFLCEDGEWRSAELQLLAPGISELVDLFPKAWLESNVLSSRYFQELPVNEQFYWNKWSKDSAKSKLHTFPLPKRRTHTYHGARAKIYLASFCQERGGSVPDSYPLKANYFRNEDFDWEKPLWEHWEKKAKTDLNFWTLIARSILKNWSKNWENTLNANVRQLGREYSHPLGHGGLVAAWLHTLRGLPCLPDIFGQPALPAELCRITPDTQPFVNVERFVHPDFDKPEYANLLDLFGVRSEPASVEPLLDRLRALSHAEDPPISRLIDLYRALDRATLRLDPDVFSSVRDIFSNEMLAYSEDGIWEKIQNLFLENPEDIPGVRTIHPEARDIRLWERVGVQRRPTLDLTIEWLNGQVRGDALNLRDRKRAYQILQSAPYQVWQKCSAWLDVSGRWVDNRDLTWSAIRSLHTKGLFESVKKATADLSMLDESTALNFCSYAGLMPLESSLEQRLVKHAPAGASQSRQWMVTLGKLLSRIRTNDDTNKDLIDLDRNEAQRLLKSKWQPVTSLKISPFLDGDPAGTERECKVVWSEYTLFAAGNSPGHHRELVREISRHFQIPNAKDAIRDCIDRNREWIEAYAREHLDIETETFSGEDDDEVISGETGSDEEDELEGKGSESGFEEEDFQEPENDEDDDGVDTAGRKDSRKQRKNFVIEGFIRCIRERGFLFEEASNYYRSAEGHIIKRGEKPFSWVELNENGIQIAAYWVGKGALDNGIEIPTEIWNLGESIPFKVYIVLIDSKTKFTVYMLSTLKHQVRNDEIEVYATKYLLRARLATNGPL
jgi:hypothetical protein